jgi:hypothetical protein
MFGNCGSEPEFVIINIRLGVEECVRQAPLKKIEIEIHTAVGHVTSRTAQVLFDQYIGRSLIQQQSETSWKRMKRRTPNLQVKNRSASFKSLTTKAI